MHRCLAPLYRSTKRDTTYIKIMSMWGWMTYHSPNRPLGFSCGLSKYEQANYHKSEVRKLVHGTNYYSSGWRLKGLTHNPERERDGPCPCSAESGITGRTKDVMLPRL